LLTTEPGYGGGDLSPRLGKGKVANLWLGGLKVAFMDPGRENEKVYSDKYK